MNHSYKSIYNEQTGTWVAVSELTAAHGKKSKGGKALLNAVLAVSGAVVVMGAAQAQIAIGVQPAGVQGTAVANGGGSPIAIGASAVVDAGGTAIGWQAHSIGVFSQALGLNATSGGAYSSALGVDANSGGGNSVAIGYATSSAGAGSTAVGWAAVSSGDFSSAIGTNAHATNLYSNALGAGANALADNSTAIGLGATANGTNSYAIGVSANSNAVDSMALGANATSNAVDSIALGAGATSNVVGSVAIGQNSVASVAAGVVGYVPASATLAQSAAIEATTSTAGAISVGNAAGGVLRQITGVAAGRADTDVVNVSQLKAINNAMVAGQTHYYSVNDGGTVGANYNNDGATDINSIAAGVGAVATERNSVSMGTSASATTAYGVAIGYKATVNATGSMGVSGQSVAIGAEASAGGFSSIAIGGNRDVVGVTTPNYGSPHAMGQGSIAIGAASFAGGIFHSTALGVDARAEVDQSLALGDGTRAQGVRSAAVGTGATVTVADGVALGSYSVANTATGIAGYVPPPADAAQTARIVATNSTLAAVSVGNAANNKFRQITGVAAGTADSDAVNVAQLVAVQGSIAAGKTKYYSVNSTGGGNELNDGATGADAIAAGKNAAAAGDNAVAMGMGATASKNDAVAIGSSSADGVGSVAIGKGASSTEDNNVALGANSVANSKAVQVNDASIPSVIATLNADGTTTYTAGPDIIYSGFAGTASGVVSVGKAGAERQIINVAPGKITANSTDAINGS